MSQPNDVGDDGRSSFYVTGHRDTDAAMTFMQLDARIATFVSLAFN